MVPGKLKKQLLNYAKQKHIRSGVIFLGTSGKPLDRSSIWRQMKQLCKAAGVKESKVFPHNLRKLFARTFYGVDKDIAKLAEEKRIIKLGLGTNMEHFDGNPEPHYHIVCCDCGRVHDIESPPLDELNKWAAERFMGTVYNHSAVFFGKCSECK